MKKHKHELVDLVLSLDEMLEITKGLNLLYETESDTTNTDSVYIKMIKEISKVRTSKNGDA